MTAEIEELVARLRLELHPEGGYYRETFRSPDVVVTAAGLARATLTSIHFLLPGSSFSAFHRLESDEAWHFYRGDPITIESIYADGTHERTTLCATGPWQTVVPAGTTFASHVERPDGFALVGCDVAPGFDFVDFSMPTRAELTARFPQHADLIARWTRR